RQISSTIVISSIGSQLLIPCPQTLGQFDQGDLRLRFTFPEVVMFAKLDQGGRLGFQLDVLGSVLVDSHSLDEMTQAQSFDQLQIHLDQSRPKLFRPSIPSSACGIHGGLRRFTEVELNEQSLPVA